MAYPIHGKVARVEKNSVLVGDSQGWEISTALDLDEITAQGDDWKTHVSGMAGWSGSMTFSCDPSNTEQKAFLDNIIAATPGTKLTDVEFNLEDTDDYFSGDLFIIGLNVNTGVGGKVLMKIDFVGDGALTLTIA